MKTRQNANHRNVPISGEMLVLLDHNAQGKDPDERGKVWTTSR
ncbi:hypothetical protein [Corynebacterium ulcerans]|nr:hypothetical protein [Corynebacterium ulcerans]